MFLFVILHCIEMNSNVCSVLFSAMRFLFVLLFAVLMLVNTIQASPEGQPKLDDNEKVVGEHANDEDRIFHWWYG